MSAIGWLFLAHGIQYALGFMLAARQGRQAVAFGFALGVLCLYTLFTPWLLWYRGESEIAGLTFDHYLPEALGVYLVGVGTFIAIWAALPVQMPRPWALRFGQELKPGPVGAVLLLWFLAFLFGLYQAGVPIGEWFDWSNSNTYLNLFGYHWPSPLADKATDGMISLGYLLVVANPWLGLVVATLLVSLFSLAGFRYRTLIMVGSVLMQKAMTVKKKSRVVGLAAFSLVLLAGMVWLTLNRIRVSQRLFMKVDNDLSHFDLRLLANETNNSQTFGVLLDWYHVHGSQADGLQATPSFVAVRILPSSFFQEGKKPIAPLLINLREAYDATPEGTQLHPAVSNLEEYYLGYGILGVLVGMGLMAWLCRWLASLGPVLGPLGTLWLFQLISRGYLPQQVDLAFFLALPVGLLYLWQRYGTGRRSHPTPP